ncbi:MAG: tRNA pseudouridine(38-40) synthase TruA [Epsilonproteobacteria bacterium]|nr:tRNA pseudouridine(38-40) synthase TruA [Campylobacterota bacterium]
MKKIKIIFSYDGSKFFGSQIQKGSKLSTVMGAFQKALTTLGLNEIAISSGRTDKGVHALNQVCHLSIPEYFFNLSKFKKSLNHLLMPCIYIKDIRFVNTDFHARFSAKKRLYRYIVSHAPYNPIFANYCSFMPSMDIDNLNDTLKAFEGIHDFGYFKKQGSQTISDTRIIFKVFAYKKGNFTSINFLGNSFLRSQIRMMCDFLFKVENGDLSRDELLSQLNLIKKISTSPAPAKGLYLSRIYY